MNPEILWHKLTGRSESILNLVPDWQIIQMCPATVLLSLCFVISKEEYKKHLGMRSPIFCQCRLLLSWFKMTNKKARLMAKIKLFHHCLDNELFASSCLHSAYLWEKRPIALWHHCITDMPTLLRDIVFQLNCYHAAMGTTKLQILMLQPVSEIHFLTHRPTKLAGKKKLPHVMYI